MVRLRCSVCGNLIKMIVHKYKRTKKCLRCGGSLNVVQVHTYEVRLMKMKK